MKLRKIDVLLAEHKPLSVEEGNVKKLGRYYYEVECPFCGKKNLVFFRNFWKGTRCKNKDCRAMFDRCNSVARRDMVPTTSALIRSTTSTTTSTWRWSDMEKPQKEFEISAERFIYELYDSGWRFRFDVPYDYKGSFAPLIAKHLVGWCDAGRLSVRPRTGEFAVMCEIDGEKFWFHVLPTSLDCILENAEME